MRRRPIRPALLATQTLRAPGAAPAERGTSAPPDGRGVIRMPKGGGIAQVPPPRIVRVPKLRAPAARPNPRKPAAVTHANGELNDLFAIFRDLPRPVRPPRRLWRRR